MKSTIIICWEDDTITRETIDETIISAGEYVKFIDGMAQALEQSRVRSWEYAPR